MKLGYSRLLRAWPLIGGAIAVLTIVGTIRRKGFVRGTIDTALNFVPYVGTMKNLLEARRGRDYIPSRPRRA